MFYGRGTKMMNYQTCLDIHSKILKQTWVYISLSYYFQHGLCVN